MKKICQKNAILIINFNFSTGSCGNPKQSAGKQKKKNLKSFIENNNYLQKNLQCLPEIQNFIDRNWLYNIFDYLNIKILHEEPFGLLVLKSY